MTQRSSGCSRRDPSARSAAGVYLLSRAHCALPVSHWGSRASLGDLGSSKAAGLWPEIFKEKKAKRKLRWFGVDWPGLPALPELHTQYPLQNCKA